MTKHSIAGSALALVLFLAGAALPAQVSIKFGKHGRHRSGGVEIGLRPHHGGHSHSNSCLRCEPGHYDVVQEQVWVPGRPHRVWVEPVYRTRSGRHGHRSRELVTPGHFVMVEGRGHHETVDRKIWVPERWVHGCGH